jgi:hypothetical protein
VTRKVVGVFVRFSCAALRYIGSGVNLGKQKLHFAYKTSGKPIG